LKVSQNQLQDLLELTVTDQVITRTKNEVDGLRNSPVLAQLQIELRASSTKYIEANNKADGLKLELKRVETDLATVEQRIKRDNNTLHSTGSARDAMAIQNELKSLAKRKGDLEEVSLELMEQLAVAQSELEVHVLERSRIEANLKAETEALQATAAKLISGMSLRTADRKQLADRIPVELLEIHQAKSRRGVPVGRLTHRECGACNMTITAAALQELLNAPADELISCPECGAILVR
jgi:predicted  nucleic acid-binding Zn-ribbon protein